MISVQSASLRRGRKLLFSNASFTIHAGEKVGLIGPNGTGKSSFFLLLKKQLELDSGELNVFQGLIAATDQEISHNNENILNYVLDGDEELRFWQRRYDSALTENNTAEIGRATDELDKRQAWQSDTKAKQILAGLGFATDDFDSPMDSFSGGWQMRLNLARALMCPADILLLDEPTNHLDMDAILWLEQWLKAFTGTLIVISHDRYFLDSLTTHTLHLNQQTLLRYTGNYSAFEKLLAERIQLEMSQQQQLEKKQKHLQKFIDRFRYKASKAKQAQSRVKQLEKLGTVVITQQSSPYSFQFADPGHMPNPLCRMENLSIGYPDKMIAERINFSLQPAERIGILGRNGAGKSTLLKTLVGDLAPLSGECWQSPKTEIGYFNQNQLASLDVNASAFEIMQRHFSADSQQQTLDYLGKFGFSGDQVTGPSGHLSGGEKSRLVLGIIIRKQPNLLILDEPTNHLDLQARDALTLALQDYAGALLLVSHDRYLLETSCDDLWLVKDQAFSRFNGSIHDYSLATLDSSTANTSDKKPTDERKLRRQSAAQQRQKLAPLKKVLRTIENKLDKQTKRLDEINNELAEERMYIEENKAQLKKCLLEQAELKQQLEITELEYLEQLEVMSQLEKD
ncbi:MAG: ATP-binding cassette domain-containing protein, partial [Enterobacterales bacterium]|nr:ATP-binding cassette domain-containing protein [Enterobacterales bacterium]